MSSNIEPMSPPVRSNAWFEKEIRNKETKYYEALSNQESVTDDTKYALKIELESLKDDYRAKWISEIDEKNQILKKRDRWNVDVG